VGLDVADRFRFDAGAAQCAGNHRRLAGETRGGVADLADTVVVDRRPADDGIDMVAIFDGVFHTFEGDDADAIAHHAALSLGVEGAAIAVGRQDAALLVQIAGAMGNADGRAAGQGDAALIGEQALAGHVDRDQRGGTVGLYRHARPAQIEFIRDGRG